VESKNFGGIDGERTVHIDGDVWDSVFFKESIEHVEDLLGALDRKAGDDDFSSSFSGMIDSFSNPVVCAGFELVLSSPIGAFHKEEIDIFDMGGVVEYIIVASANIAREEKTFCFSVIFILDFKQDLGAA